jgi:hypothetical protein
MIGKTNPSDVNEVGVIYATKPTGVAKDFKITQQLKMGIQFSWTGIPQAENGYSTVDY